MIPFVQNLPWLFTNSYFEPFAAVRSPNLPISTEPFWTALIGSGFQSNTSEDADPEALVTKGASPHGNGNPDAGSLTGICVIFVETIYDAGGSGQGEIIAHELAHTLGVPHNAGGLMDEHPAAGSVFLPADLKRVREYSHP
jgi:hypothetical protein